MKSKLLSAPYIVWMILFTLIPLCIVFYYALTDSITGEFTLANLASMGTYLPIFLRSIWLSLFASLICLVIGYPVAYFIAQCKPLTQRFLEMLDHAADVHELSAAHARVGRDAARTPASSTTSSAQLGLSPLPAHPQQRRGHSRHGL